MTNSAPATKTRTKKTAPATKTLRQEMADEMFGEETATEKCLREATEADATTLPTSISFIPTNIHQLNGGKGLSRREICQRAVDKLRTELEAAEARLLTAILAEQEGTKPKSKESKAWTKAAKVLRGLGWDEDRITAELGDKPE